MKLYLDDERETPSDWFRTYTVDHTIDLLNSGVVKELSLDHDLGVEDSNGYDVLLWIEEQVALHGFIPPKIYIHSANSSAKVKMMLAVEQIIKLSNS